jgi:Protein of unknown function (DUF2934)
MQLSKTPPDRDETVRALAHKLWEEEGRPDGRANDHWLRAVTLVDSIEAPKAKKPAAPKAKAPAKNKLRVS